MVVMVVMPLVMHGGHVVVVGVHKVWHHGERVDVALVHHLTALTIVSNGCVCSFVPRLLPLDLWKRAFSSLPLFGSIYWSYFYTYKLTTSGMEPTRQAWIRIRRFFIALRNQ